VLQARRKGRHGLEVPEHRSPRGVLPATLTAMCGANSPNRPCLHRLRDNFRYHNRPVTLTSHVSKPHQPAWPNGRRLGETCDARGPARTTATFNAKNAGVILRRSPLVPFRLTASQASPTKRVALRSSLPCRPRHSESWTSLVFARDRRGARRLHGRGARGRLLRHSDRHVPRLSCLYEGTIPDESSLSCGV